MKKYAIISMDVEDWYHTYFPQDNVDRSVSLLDGLDNVLEIMDRYGIRGSFFVIGEIADKLKEKLRDIDLSGHDIACHGMQHLRPLSMSKSEFMTQLTEAKSNLEAILGHRVNGYRAPSFAIDDDMLDIVEKCGFLYDSSKLRPQKSSKYGSLSLDGFSELSPCIYKRDDFTEFEVSTQPLFGFNMLLGGGYIRMLPWIFMKFMTQRYLRTGKPYVMYIHPIDLSRQPMPHVPGISLNKYLRTHVGRRHMERRFIKVIELLKKNGYEFVTFSELMQLRG